MQRPFPKVLKRLLGAALIVLAGGVFSYALGVWGSPTHVPADLLRAREDAARVGQEIVALTKATGDKIKAVNLSDLEGNREQALALIEEARFPNEGAYGKAFELTGHLERIAASLGEVSSVESQRLAYEAVASELALTSEFIVYTRVLDMFLVQLGAAIGTGSAADRQAAMATLTDVNARAERINQLNEKFIERMRAFDQSL